MYTHTVATPLFFTYLNSEYFWAFREEIHTKKLLPSRFPTGYMYRFRRTQTSVLLHHLSLSLLYFYPDLLPLSHPHRLHRQPVLTLKEDLTSENSHTSLFHRLLMKQQDGTGPGQGLQNSLGKYWSGRWKNGSTGLNNRCKPKSTHFLFQFRH